MKLMLIFFLLGLMTEQNLLDYNLLQLTEIHNHNNNLSFNFFTEAPKVKSKHEFLL